MTSPLRIEFEPDDPLSFREELAVLRAAYWRKGTPVIRARLANRLARDDDLAGVADLLAGAPDLGVGEELMLASAYLAQENAEGDALALAAADRAVSGADQPRLRAEALALRGKAEKRLGRVDAALATLREALALDPHGKDAFKRIAAIGLEAGESGEVLALYHELAREGVAHARLFAAGALAHARSGEAKAARELMGIDRYFSAAPLAPPPGWNSIAAFDAALAQELLAHPELRYERYGSASELTWRIERMPHAAAPLARMLIDSLASAITAYLERIADDDHPWAAARPDRALLRTWCVITDGDGFENWHVHQFGWLSGAYYVRVPEEIATGESEAGCIALGLPEDLAGSEGAAAYGMRVVRPEDGLLLMFPSHLYHRTFPHGASDRRICVAFDLKPITA